VGTATREQRAAAIRPAFAAEYDRLRREFDFNSDRALKTIGEALQQAVGRVQPGGHDRIQGEASASARHFLNGHTLFILGRDYVVECPCRKKGVCSGLPAGWVLEGWEAAAGSLPIADPREAGDGYRLPHNGDPWSIRA